MDLLDALKMSPPSPKKKEKEGSSAGAESSSKPALVANRSLSSLHLQEKTAVTGVPSKLMKHSLSHKSSRSSLDNKSTKSLNELMSTKTHGSLHSGEGSAQTSSESISLVDILGQGPSTDGKPKRNTSHGSRSNGGFTVVSADDVDSLASTNSDESGSSNPNLSRSKTKNTFRPKLSTKDDPTQSISLHKKLSVRIASGFQNAFQLKNRYGMDAANAGTYGGLANHVATSPLSPKTKSFQVISATQSGSGARTNDIAQNNIFVTKIQNPSILSLVSKYFKDQIQLGLNTFENIDYPSSFTGRDAVDMLCRLLGSNDRQLAIYVGLSMILQKFISDVQYTGNFKDDPFAIYVFTSDRITSKVKASDIETSLRNIHILVPHSSIIEENETNPQQTPKTDDGSSDNNSDANIMIVEDSNAPVKVNSYRQEVLPSGVITAAGDCYSPRCTFGDQCYSPRCPKKTSMLTKSLARSARQKASSNITETDNGQKLWSNTVPREIYDKTSELERKRQEIIFEIIKTEKEYVEDLKTLQRVYLEPLIRSDIIPKARRAELIAAIFGNINDIVHCNDKLLSKLVERQNDEAVVLTIGDIFRDWAPTIQSHYVIYGANQALAKNILDTELRDNLLFQKFCEANERRPESRKLPIQSFLSRPTTRMGRYPILLDTLIGRTPLDHEDRVSSQQAADSIRETLSKINVEAGRADNLLRLKIIHDRLVFGQDDETTSTTTGYSKKNDLGLLDAERTLIRDGVLKKRHGVDMIDLDVFLFDNYLLLTRKRATDKNVEYKVYKSPVPLYLLRLVDSPSTEEPPTMINSRGSFSTTYSQGNSAIGAVSGAAHSRRSSFTNTITSPPPDAQTKTYPIQIVHLGRNGHQIILFASSHADRKMWIEKIEQATIKVLEKMNKFKLVPLLGKMSDNIASVPDFLQDNPILYACPLENGKNMLLACENGVYFGQTNSASSFVKILDVPKVTQMEMLQDYKVLLVLSEKKLLTFPLDVIPGPGVDVNLLASDYATTSSRKAKRLSSHVSFFQVGTNYNKLFIIAVKTKMVSTYLKVFEHVDFDAQKRKRNKFGSMLMGRMRNVPDDEDFKIFKTVYIPSESTCVLFFKTKICVGCFRGFEIIDLLSLQSQALLDSNDKSLKFLTSKEYLSPMAIFMVSEEEYLLCFQEYGVYVNKLGQSTRTRKNVDDAPISPKSPTSAISNESSNMKGESAPVLNWIAAPVSFAYNDPFLLVFDKSFVEIREAISGSLIQVVALDPVRMVLQDHDQVICSSTYSITMNAHQTSASRSTSPQGAVPGGSGSGFNMMAYKKFVRTSSEASGQKISSVAQSTISSAQSVRTTASDDSSDLSVLSPSEEIRISLLYSIEPIDNENQTFIDKAAEISQESLAKSSVESLVRPRENADAIRKKLATGVRYSGNEFIRSSRKLSLRASSFEDVFQARQTVSLLQDTTEKIGIDKEDDDEEVTQEKPPPPIMSSIDDEDAEEEELTQDHVVSKEVAPEIVTQEVAEQQDVISDMVEPQETPTQKPLPRDTMSFGSIKNVALLDLEETSFKDDE